MNTSSCGRVQPLWRALEALIAAFVALGVVSVIFHLAAGVIFFLLSVILIVFVTVVYSKVLLPMRDCRQEQREKQYASDILSKQAELDALQSQINPHFLYNTLDSIRGQALMEGAEDIADMTEALSTFFRYSISNRNNVVTLDEELENVRNYFMIQQFRFNNRFQLQILPFSQELGENCHLPKMTLQPILENAILHGMEEKIGPGTITIRVMETDSRIVITISDDGAGMNEETLLQLQAKLRGDEPVSMKRTRGNGIALPNVSRRIKLLFGEDCGIYVMSTLGLGTDVEITLPSSRGTAHDL